MRENLNLFLETAKINKEEAKRIFFGKNFKEYYLQKEETLRTKYDLLQSGKDKEQILEEFLVCVGVSDKKIFPLEEEKTVTKTKEIEEKKEVVKKSVWEELEECYLSFRCGNIKLDEFCSEVYERTFEENSAIASLIRLQLALLQNRKEEAQNRMEQILEERPWEDSVFEESYYYYIKALCEKREETTKQALDIIFENARKDVEHKQIYVWFLLYLDEEYAFSMKNQIALLRELYRQEPLRPFLQYEVISLWNRNPLLLYEVDDFVIEQMKFGMKMQILSKEVCDEFARVTREMVDFDETAFELLEELYRNAREEMYLESICHMIVNTKTWKREYHSYLEEAMKASFKVNGIFESYIRTMDQSKYEPMNEKVLHYFAYSSSLNEDEYAYLYANILKNQDAYGNIVKGYLLRIKIFVMEAMKKGRISDIYVVLYQYYVPRLMEQGSIIEEFPNILFKHYLHCENKAFTKVAIKQREREAITVYPMIDGHAYCDILSQDYIAVFYDRDENPYIASADFSSEALFYQKEYYELCKKEKILHENILLKEAGIYEEKEDLKESDIRIVKQILENESISPSIYEAILENLLKYYYEHQDAEELEEYLHRVSWEQIRQKNQMLMIEYFISRNFYYEAIQGMERFGFDELNPELLEKVASYLLEQDYNDKPFFLTHMCEILFKNGCKNKKILGYLQQHTPENVDYLVELWLRGKEVGIFDPSYTRYVILRQMKDDLFDETLQRIFLEYISLEEDQEFSNRILDLFGKQYLMKETSFLPEILDYMTDCLLRHRPDALHCPVAWIYAIEKKGDLSEKEKKLAEYLLEDLLEQDIYLPIFLKFEGRLLLPKKIYSISFVRYQGKKNQKVILHCESEKDEVFWEVPMKELADGIYIGYYRPFVREDLDIYVTMDGKREKIKQGLQIEQGTMVGKGLKYHKINEMLQQMDEDTVYDSMLEFEEVEFMMQKALEPWF